MATNFRQSWEMFWETSNSPDPVLSVSGLTTYLKELLEEDPQLQQIWVTGEVSSATPHRSGLFFTLQDPDAPAAINCVVWSSMLPKLAALPEPGEQVLILGKISLYAQRGNYKLMVWQILPAGEGLRALRYRQLHDRLNAEGLFDGERKQALPDYPTIIAVVTSPQAAAWGDIQRTLRQRHPGLNVLLSPAIVQGDQAPPSIVQAIQRVERDGRAEVLILSRGGGAVEDLACFNDERVVRAIADCTIPILSGIGHERDASLADLAADLCAHTPTAAAEQVVPSLQDLYQAHWLRVGHLQQAVEQHLDRAHIQVESLRRRLQRLHPDRQIRQQAQHTQYLKQRLIHSVTHQLQQATQKCDMLHQSLLMLDPKAALKRGYALVRQENGKIVRSAKDLGPGQTVNLQLGQGNAQAQITEIQN